MQSQLVDVFLNTEKFNCVHYTFVIFDGFISENISNLN